MAPSNALRPDGAITRGPAGPPRGAARDGHAAPPPRERSTVMISPTANDRLDKLAERSGLAKTQILDWLLERQPLAELLRALKAEGLTRRRTGRPKGSIFGGK